MERNGRIETDRALVPPGREPLVELGKVRGKLQHGSIDRIDGFKDFEEPGQGVVAAAVATEAQSRVFGFLKRPARRVLVQADGQKRVEWRSKVEIPPARLPEIRIGEEVV